MFVVVMIQSHPSWRSNYTHKVMTVKETLTEAIEWSIDYYNKERPVYVTFTGYNTIEYEGYEPPAKEVFKIKPVRLCFTYGTIEITWIS